MTVSKKFEISFSHRCYNPRLSADQNKLIYGNETLGAYGHGHNCDVTVVFSGPVDPITGMLINVSDIKPIINELLLKRYDHKFLNADTEPFANGCIPTFENIALTLLADIRGLFTTSSAKVFAIHLHETDQIDITAYTDGRIERSLWIDFSAARKTSAPDLTEEENRKLFGIATRDHGHHYRLRLTLQNMSVDENGLLIDAHTFDEIRNRFIQTYDHRHLNNDIDSLKQLPITTESLATYFYNELNKQIALNRIRLSENDYFFVEFSPQDGVYIGLKSIFHAAHRLHSTQMSADGSYELYGKCNNPQGHGHTYKVELVIGGSYDKRTGTLYDLSALIQKLNTVLDKYNYKHLDKECDEFRNTVSTSENLVKALWEHLNDAFGNRIFRVSLWETPNNRFTLRRSVTQGQ